VKVGLYFDLRNPPPWRRDWSEHYRDALDQCTEADHLGADSLWFSEHHGFDDGYLPQPLTFAAAAAAHTQRARLGTSILIAPLRPAAQLAEEAAVVDILSGGRLDLGLGAGYRAAEFALYGADPHGRGRATFARVRRMRELWKQGTVTPPPVQERLPIWVGASGDWTARETGRCGEGLLRVGPELLDAYRAGLAQGGHDPASARMCGGVNVFLSEDPERDWPAVKPHLAYQWDSYARYSEGADAVHGERDPDVLRARGIESGAMRGFVIATPAEAAHRIRTHLAGTPVDTIYLWATLPGLPSSLARRHVELACTELRAALADA
jgi:alkanesulfonate monooxygenase SsuD/methylene tetrahydromethanopterin reductase-like flavin-dependent oxidoreductase (luciferase family)